MGDLKMAPLKFGLIGCGRIAEANHIPEIASLGKKAVVAALFDTRKGKAEALAAKFNLKPKICKSLEELLASDIDAVMIATPNLYHHQQTLAALNAGKHVLVEKPMASSLEEADEMIDLAAKKGLVLQVNQSLRYHAPYKKVKEIIDAGTIGKPLHARCLRASNASPDVNWSPGATWFVQKKYKGSLVTDIAVHMADALHWFFGPVEGIMAKTRCLSHEVPDNVVALFTFENGASAVLELSWTFPKGSSAFEIYGEDGYISIVPEGIEIWKKGAEKPRLVKNESLKKVPNSHAEFLKAVAEGSKHSWKFGRGALALCMAILESSSRKGSVIPKFRAIPEAGGVKKAAQKKAASGTKAKPSAKKK